MAKFCQINRVKNSFDWDTLRTIISALVLSKLFYCSTVWSNTTATNIKKLQAVQNFACRIITKTFIVLKPYECVPWGWSGLGSMIGDHSDHGRSNEPMNPGWTRIRRFIRSAMIREISDHWSWSGSSQRKAPIRLQNYKSPSDTVCGP